MKSADLRITGDRLMQELGRQIFGGLWSADDIRVDVAPGQKSFSALFPSETAEPAHRKQFVQRRILEALADGTLVAEIDLPVLDWSGICARAWSESPNFKTYFLDDHGRTGGASIDDAVVRLLGRHRKDDKDAEDEVEDEEFDALHSIVSLYRKAHKFIVSGSMVATLDDDFWTNIVVTEKSNSLAETLNWVSSRVRATSSDFILSLKQPQKPVKRGLKFRSKLLPTDVDTERSNLVKLAIQQAERELISPREYHFSLVGTESDFKRLGQEPTYINATGWGERFMEGERYFWPLVIASAWRVMAFKLQDGKLDPHQPSHGSQIEIEEALAMYLLHQNDADFGAERRDELPSPASLKKIVKAIFDQFYGREETSNIFFGVSDTELMMKRKMPAKTKTKSKPKSKSKSKSKTVKK